MKRFIILCGRAAILTAGFVLVGVVFNTLRPSGIDLVARTEYQIFAPCPESTVEAESVTSESVQGQRVLYLDARPEEEYAQEHIAGAMSFPYPVLGDPPADRVEALKQRGVPIVTYGSGGRDRLGEMMADLLTELGVPQVTHLEGGLESWRANDGATEGDGVGGDA